MDISQFRCLSIPLTQGKWAVVDIEDAPLVLVHKWYWHICRSQKTGYARTKTREGKQIYMHRMILGITDRKIPIDHRNGDGLNNRRNNLRIADPTLNSANQIPRKGTISGFKGVAITEEGNWMARICVRGHMKCLGTYRTPEEAARAYNRGALQYFGEFARLNEVR